MGSFSEWHAASGKTQCDVANDLGISQAYLSRLLSGSAHPSLDLAALIQTYSNGKVHVGDWPKFKVLSGRSAPQEAAE